MIGRRAAPESAGCGKLSLVRESGRIYKARQIDSVGAFARRLSVLEQVGV